MFTKTCLILSRRFVFVNLINVAFKSGSVFHSNAIIFMWANVTAVETVKTGWGRGEKLAMHLLGSYCCGTHSSLKQVQLGALGSWFSASQQGQYCSSHAILTQASALCDSEARPRGRCICKKDFLSFSYFSSGIVTQPLFVSLDNTSAPKEAVRTCT